MYAAKPEERARVLNRAGRERALIQAAAKLFAAKGYEATTTREIAAVAGCAEGLISRYFKGKAGLLKALIRLHFAEEADEFRDERPAAPTLGEDIVRRVMWDVDHFAEDHEFLRVIIPQFILTPELAREVAEVGPGRHLKLVLEKLRTHSAFCTLPPEEQEALAQLVLAIGFMFGFWIPVMGEDRARTRRGALMAANILARAFRAAP